MTFRKMRNVAYCREGFLQRSRKFKQFSKLPENVWQICLYYEIGDAFL